MNGYRPIFYVIIFVAVVSLLAIVYYSQQVTEGFTSDSKSLIEHFQAIPEQYKPMVCETFREQIAKLTQTDHSENNTIVAELSKYMNAVC